MKRFLTSSLAVIFALSLCLFTSCKMMGDEEACCGKDGKCCTKDGSCKKGKCPKCGMDMDKCTCKKCCGKDGKCCK